MGGPETNERKDPESTRRLAPLLFFFICPPWRKPATGGGPGTPRRRAGPGPEPRKSMTQRPPRPARPPSLATGTRHALTTATTPRRRHAPCRVAGSIPELADPSRDSEDPPDPSDTEASCTHRLIPKGILAFFATKTDDESTSSAEAELRSGTLAQSMRYETFIISAFIISALIISACDMKRLLTLLYANVRSLAPGLPAQGREL